MKTVEKEREEEVEIIDIEADLPCRHQFIRQNDTENDVICTCTTCTYVCHHPYLNKWDGVYVCMDWFCNLSLNHDRDVTRIRNEEQAELLTPIDIIPEDSNVGKMSQQRGVSIGFLLQFTKKYKCWKWNSWDVIRHIIKPATEKTRCRYVELPEMIEYVGPAQSFISYAQQGCWGDLVAAVCDGADPKRYVWIDIFAVRQWPSSSPDLDFASTIENCTSFIIVCSYMKEVEEIDDECYTNRNTKGLSEQVRKRIAFLRVWCLVEAHKAAMMNIPMIMRVGLHQRRPNGSVYFNTELASAMLNSLMRLVDIEQAEATVASDRERIYLQFFNCPLPQFPPT